MRFAAEILKRVGPGMEKRGGHASVHQQQQAAVQREDAYAEMVLTAAIKLQQEADQRKASAVNCEVLP